MSRLEIHENVFQLSSEIGVMTSTPTRIITSRVPPTLSISTVRQRELEDDIGELPPLRRPAPHTVEEELNRGQRILASLPISTQRPAQVN